MKPGGPTDTPDNMIRDLRFILDGWEYEPGKISVRKIIGRDGREKVQTRIDLGLLQFEYAGRPDGQRPMDCESLLQHHEHRLQRHVEQYGDDEDFVLTPEECQELRHEAYLYYQRYLSLFVLEEYAGVVRDTARNLRVVELCERYAAVEHDRALVREQRGYVTMMNARARAHLRWEQEHPDDALQIVEDALGALEALADEADGIGTQDGELRVLHKLRREILESLPVTAPARLKTELNAALAAEDYERAALLRDALAQQGRAG